MSRRTARWIAVAALVVLAGTLACAVNPVTGKHEFSLMSESQEIALGEESDPQIVAMYGVYADAAVGAYVDSMGQRLARVSHRPNLKYTFRVVDSPVINAFALPGGYVYITRGILAHMNNEAELAIVLGHEIGHVTARHGAEQYSRQQLAGLGLGVGSILSPTVARVGALAQTGLGLLFLKYGRDDETQADELGVQYASKAGFDPERGVKFFEVLDRQQQESGETLPGWLSTHPAPADRVSHTRQLAASAKIAGTRYTVGESAHKSRIDGIVFGDDPRQGFVEGSVFKHPALKFEWHVPDGWKVQNTPAAVVATEPNGAAQLRLTMAEVKGTTPAAFVRQVAEKNSARIVEGGEESINGYAAYIAVLQVPTENGAVQHVLLAGIQREASGPIFRILGAAEGLSTWQSRLYSSIRSFGPLRDAKAQAIQPNRVHVVAVPKHETLQEAVGGFKDVPVRLGTVALLNNLQPESPLESGFRLKMIRGTWQGGS
jgi:predicted Zn-dependent protease